MTTLESVLSHPWMHTLLGLAALVLIAWLVAKVGRRLLARIMRVVSQRTVWTWDDALVRSGVFGRLAQVLPMLVLAYGIKLVPGVPETVELVVANVALALIALFVALALSAALTAGEDLFQASPRGRERSIKGYVQLLKIFVFVIGAIIIIANLIDKSPLSLLAGLGAVSAVLLLIFKDTIMSVVASVQLGSNDMLRVGDWIEMPSMNADGYVIDIALHTVKVQNWDKTISTIPTWKLISESYRNWRGMIESGGRRISRALYLDATAARFLDDDEIARLSNFTLLSDYFARKREDLAQWNAALGDHGTQSINQRRLSNLGTFRAYAHAYLEANPRLNHNMFTLVRQLEPGPTGIPLQLYCFSASVAWADYEGTQADIFDHLIAILPEFGLALFQQPTGADWRKGLHELLPAASR
ncbi:MAG: mechanosensitive ion channel domain-containing protein [Rhodanobacter sp.]